MFDFLYELLGTVLSWFYSWTGSYALALLFFALAFKIVFLPFGIKQQQNQVKLAKLRPKIAKIEKKYAGRNDQPTLQKKQQEIMELQQKEGYSPLSGCLPLLIQFPIIIILYNVIREPLSYIAKISDEIINAVASVVGGSAADQIGLIGKINEYCKTPGNADILLAQGLDISKIPDFNLFGANLAANPSFNPLNILVLIPFIAAAFQWLSMWLMKKWNGTAQPVAGADAQTQMSMRMMDLIMPLMTLFFAFNFSGMLGLYWIYQSILGILQSFVLSRLMPLPHYSDEELREMEKAEKAKAKAQREVIKQQPKVKSLHYIDDEDYDTLPEIQSSSSQDSSKGFGGIEGGNLKK